MSRHVQWNTLSRATVLDTFARTRPLWIFDVQDAAEEGMTPAALRALWTLLIDLEIVGCHKEALVCKDMIRSHLKSSSRSLAGPPLTEHPIEVLRRLEDFELHRFGYLAAWASGENSQNLADKAIRDFSAAYRTESTKKTLLMTSFPRLLEFVRLCATAAMPGVAREWLAALGFGVPRPSIQKLKLPQLDIRLLQVFFRSESDPKSVDEVFYELLSKSKVPGSAAFLEGSLLSSRTELIETLLFLAMTLEKRFIPLRAGIAMLRDRTSDDQRAKRSENRADQERR